MQTINEGVVNDEERWTAVVRRDPVADGLFCYAVVTTGVYCRPSCPSRPALRKNVRFYETGEEAERAGFRPCKRCKPDQPSLVQRYATMVAGICRMIENAETSPDLAALAQAAGMSRYHFHRVFKAVTGVTPKAYAAAHREQRLRRELVLSDTVTQAIYGAGFNSSGRFYAASAQVLGMTPSVFRAGGANAVIRFAVGECSLGAILVAATDKGVCAILLGDDADALLRDLQDRFLRAELIGADAIFEQTVARVVGLVEAPTQCVDLPLDIRGTVFQQRVWQALREMPAGSTASYSEIAERIGAPRAARAVAQACAANALAVAIPCHRVVRSDGALSGYRWGVERKRALLEREMDRSAVAMTDPFAAAIAHLAGSDPDLANLIARVGRCGLQPKPEREPYEALIRAVAYQQLHAKAAEAILARFLALYPAFPSPEDILETDKRILRACGFSAAKITTIRGIAERTLDGVVPERSVAMRMTDEELIARLVALRGIGRWTVEMLLVFTLERPDVLPADDFGVREGWRVLKSLPRRPTPGEMSIIGQPWSPYRSVAAWYLWRAAG